MKSLGDLVQLTRIRFAEAIRLALFGKNMDALRFRAGTPSRRKHPYNAKPGKGHVHLGNDYSLRKLMRAARRGVFQAQHPTLEEIKRHPVTYRNHLREERRKELEARYGN